MLRITVVKEDKRTVLKLEGRLAGPWVEELACCWHSLKKADRSSQLVDVAAVSFVSSEGKDLLRRLHREGASLVGGGPLTSSIVDEITAQERSAP